MIAKIMQSCRPSLAQLASTQLLAFQGIDWLLLLVKIAVAIVVLVLAVVVINWVINKLSERAGRRGGGLPPPGSANRERGHGTGPAAGDGHRASGTAPAPTLRSASAPTVAEAETLARAASAQGALADEVRALLPQIRVAISEGLRKGWDGLQKELRDRDSTSVAVGGQVLGAAVQEFHALLAFCPSAVTDRLSAAHAKLAEALIGAGWMRTEQDPTAPVDGVEMSGSNVRVQPQSGWQPPTWQGRSSQVAKGALSLELRPALSLKCDIERARALGSGVELPPANDGNYAVIKPEHLEILLYAFGLLIDRAARRAMADQEEDATGQQWIQWRQDLLREHPTCWGPCPRDVPTVDVHVRSGSAEAKPSLEVPGLCSKTLKCVLPPHRVVYVPEPAFLQGWQAPGGQEGARVMEQLGVHKWDIRLLSDHVNALRAMWRQSYALENGARVEQQRQVNLMWLESLLDIRSSDLRHKAACGCLPPRLLDEWNDLCKRYEDADLSFYTDEHLDAILTKAAGVCTPVDWPVPPSAMAPNAGRPAWPRWLRPPVLRRGAENLLPHADYLVPKAVTSEWQVPVLDIAWSSGFKIAAKSLQTVESVWRAACRIEEKLASLGGLTKPDEGLRRQVAKEYVAPLLELASGALRWSGGKEPSEDAWVEGLRRTLQKVHIRIYFRREAVEEYFSLPEGERSPCPAVVDDVSQELLERGVWPWQSAGKPVVASSVASVSPAEERPWRACLREAEAALTDDRKKPVLGILQDLRSVVTDLEKRLEPVRLGMDSVPQEVKAFAAKEYWESLYRVGDLAFGLGQRTNKGETWLRRVNEALNVLGLGLVSPEEGSLDMFEKVPSDQEPQRRPAVVDLKSRDLWSKGRRPAA